MQGPKKVMVFDWGFATSGCHLVALKCIETYGIQNYHHVCSNSNKFLNYKNEMVKYNS